MKSHGFTLVEVLIVIAIMAIILSIGTQQFSVFSEKAVIEKQTRQLYGDIMEMRSRTLYEKRNRGIRLSASSYKIYSSATDTSPFTLLGNPVATVNLTANVTYSNGTDIIFNTSGLLTAVSNKSICVSTSNSASVDSIVVSKTQIKLGKLKDGTNCDDDNITAKQ